MLYTVGCIATGFQRLLTKKIMRSINLEKRLYFLQGLHPVNMVLLQAGKYSLWQRPEDRHFKGGQRRGSWGRSFMMKWIWLIIHVQQVIRGTINTHESGPKAYAFTIHTCNI